MTKKRSSEILSVKMEIFPEETSFRNLGPRNFFPPPQTRRQVSATVTNDARQRCWGIADTVSFSQRTILLPPKIESREFVQAQKHRQLTIA